MTADLIAVPVVFIVVYLLVLFMGLLIRRGMTWLIAGYDASQVRDEKGLARWVGSGVMGIGVIGLVCAAAMFVFPDAMLSFVIVSLVVTLGGVITLAGGGRRFFKQ
jgi:hypothetical protein